MIKVLFEIYKVLGRIGIKPKDIMGMGENIVKMGKSLFNTRPNPKLLTFIEKNQKIPTKILENIKLHARTLKNATESQKNLFLENIKSIQKAKTPKMPIKPQSPVTGVQKPGASVKEQATEAFKGWTPKVIKGGKDPLASGGRAGFDQGSDETGVKLYPRASVVQTSGPPKDYLGEGIIEDVRDIDYGITGLYEGDNWFAGAEMGKGNVNVEVTQDGTEVFNDTMGKDEVVNFIAGFGDPEGNKFQVKVDDDFENVSIVLKTTFATGGIANHFRVR